LEELFLRKLKMQLQAHEHLIPGVTEKPWRTFLGKIIRLLGLWLSFFGLFSISTTCPICGQPGCPVGVGSAGLLSGAMAVFLHSGKAFLAKFKTLFLPAKSK
jgi:hypothetical protein